MTGEEFTAFLESRIALIRETLDGKAKEYGSEDDRLKNVTRGCQIAGQTSTAYIWSLLTKHLECTREIAHGRLSDEFAEEKIGDAINWLIILEAQITEERAKC